MNEEMIRLLERAFEAGFDAGKAYQAGSGLMMRTAWIFWRQQLYLSHQSVRTTEEVLQGQPDNPK